MPTASMSVEFSTTVVLSTAVRYVYHYKNKPTNNATIYSNLNAVKFETFELKNFEFFLVFIQNIDCGHTLEPPHQSGSYKYCS